MLTVLSGGKDLQSKKDLFFLVYDTLGAFGKELGVSSTPYAKLGLPLGTSHNIGTDFTDFTIGL